MPTQTQAQTHTSNTLDVEVMIQSDSTVATSPASEEYVPASQRAQSALHLDQISDFLQLDQLARACVNFR